MNLCLPKKGSLSDVHIMLDHECTLKSFVTQLTEEKGKFSYQDNQHPGLVYLYITEGAQPTKRKRKQDAPEPFASKATSANQVTDDILHKYLPELTSRQVNNSSSRVFLVALYLNLEEFQKCTSLGKLEVTLLKFQQDRIKFLLILEDVKEWIRAQCITKSSDDSMPIKEVNIEYFNTWLLRMQLDHNIDHCCTTSTKSTNDVLAGCISSTIQAKYTKEVVNFGGSKNFNEGQAELAGVTNLYQFKWIQMLQSIQGITEARALAVVKRYPSYKCLMSAYRRTQVEERVHLLSQISYSDHVDDPNDPNQKKVGPTLSERIYILLTTNNPDEALFQ